MPIILSNKLHSFAVFQLGNDFYLTILAAGSLKHDMTIRLTAHEVQTFRADHNKAIATASDVVGRTEAYRHRLVEPPLLPR